jgi:3-phosphoshikimate 1-carboxyvinyltransferase
MADERRARGAAALRRRAMFDIPFIDIPPLRTASGTVRLPGSKSISNRVLLLAGLAQGRTVVHEPLASDDTRVMLDALRALGCGIETLDHGDLAVTGLGGRLAAHGAELFLGNAGTAMRPLTAALALLAATQGGDFVLRGVARMHDRPIGDLVDALRALGCRIDELGRAGYPPLRIHGQAGARLDLSRPIAVRGDVSSQFLSALLLALPLVAADHDLHLDVHGELISKPYVDMTLKLLQRFGIDVARDGWRRFTIPAGSVYRSPGQIHVEGDASSASYFVALGAVAAHGGAPLRIDGVGLDSIQGDIAFVQAAMAMGAQVRGVGNSLLVSRGSWPLQPLQLDCVAIPDAAMTLAVMALFADGRTLLTGIGSWRVKETDRIAAMATELRKLGAGVTAGDDFIEIDPPRAWRHAAIDTYDDHRMAMCLALAALNPLAGRTDSGGPGLPVRIRDPRCVGKTFPDFFETLFGVVGTDPADVPVITVDGPTASGKGTLAAALAARLGYHLLDSGALYRATALAALDDGIGADDESALARTASWLDLRFDAGGIGLRGRRVDDELRQEHVGRMASQISALPQVREALHALQLAFRRVPGLVADGRDMGTIVFPDAALKVFLTASAEQRAQRRYNQLISKGIQANIQILRADLEARDARDRSRSVAPLVPAVDALLLDNSDMSIDESVDAVLGWWQQRRPFA